MEYRAAIFDFDGTLMDTLEDLADCMNATLKEFGMPGHPVDPYRYFVGDGMINLARRATPEGTPLDVLEKIAARMGEKYAENWANKTRPYAGIPEMLAALRGGGLKLAVLSNKPDSFTRVMADHYFSGIFDVVFGAREGVERKPDPAGALEIAGILGVAPAACLYFGDTNTDMKTGRAAGMRTIGVTWGFRPLRELIDSGAEAVIDSPHEALALLEPGAARS